MGEKLSIHNSLPSKDEVSSLRKLLKSLKDIGPFDVASNATPYSNIRRLIYQDSYPHVNQKNLNVFLNEFGLNPDEMISAWHASKSGLQTVIKSDMKELAWFYNTNFSRVCSLEAYRRGSAKVLSEEFGIKSFGRYPREILKDQYKERNNTSKPYGIAIFPRDDWNGVFYDNRLSAVKENLNSSHGLRILEVESIPDMEKKILSLDARYNTPDNKGQKISFGIIFAHGTQRSLLVNKNSDGRLWKHNFFDMETSWKLRQCFDEDATIILVSCETGAPDGLGEKFANELGRKVMAPNKETGTPNIRVYPADDKLIFDVKFRGVGPGVQVSTKTFYPK